jgi:hypothetical protein
LKATTHGPAFKTPPGKKKEDKEMTIGKIHTAVKEAMLEELLGFEKMFRVAAIHIVH